MWVEIMTLRGHGIMHARAAAVSVGRELYQVHTAPKIYFTFYSVIFSIIFRFVKRNSVTNYSTAKSEMNSAL